MYKAEIIDGVISDYLASSGLSVTQLSASLGITTVSLAAKRSGERGWKWAEILKLSELTGATPNTLAGLERKKISVSK